MSMTRECPECSASLQMTTQPLLHEILPCGDCGIELEIIGLNPLAIEVAPEVEEDWGE